MSREWLEEAIKSILSEKIKKAVEETKDFANTIDLEIEEIKINIEMVTLNLERKENKPNA